jgi:acyl-CoA thioester hydrolase
MRPNLKNYKSNRSLRPVDSPKRSAAHRTICRVIYADTDNMGIAYHANYFRWFEIGRTELFRELGLPYREIERRGYFLPIAETGCRFRAPARYDDLLVIETAIDRSYRAALKCDYTVYGEDGQGVVAEGFTKHACVDAKGRVVRPPSFLLEFIRADAPAIKEREAI